MGEAVCPAYSGPSCRGPYTTFRVSTPSPHFSKVLGIKDIPVKYSGIRSLLPEFRQGSLEPCVGSWKLKVGPEFFEPLPEEELDAWEQ